MTASEIYDGSVKQLPKLEQLRLAALILNDIDPNAKIDVSDEWSEEDLRDAAVWTMTRPGSPWADASDAIE